MKTSRLTILVMAVAALTAAVTIVGMKPVFAQEPEFAPGQENASAQKGKVMWINHLELLPGDPSVTTLFNAISSGVGGGLSGLIIQSNATGETSPTGGNKVVETALEVPAGFTVNGVRVCYELSSNSSYISQIRLAQVQNPPSSASVLLDDPTDLTNNGPVCVNSKPTSINPSEGPLLLSLRVNFGDTADKIVVRGLGLLLS